MRLPFTREQFFAVFSAYNQAVWPGPILLLLLAFAMLLAILFTPRRAGRPVALGLAGLWAWQGLVYHLGFFRVINPLASTFALLCVVSAGLFFWHGIDKRLAFDRPAGVRGAFGLFLALFALALYPLLVQIEGHGYPAIPTFGAPCPTTLFTCGVLLMARPPLSPVIGAGPVIWALIGSSAAFTLGVSTDLALVPAALGVIAAIVYDKFKNRLAESGDDSQ